MLKKIAVFCGSSLDTPEKYDVAADHVGRVIARQGRVLVYGSGSRGLMGKVAMGAQKEGGYVISVNVERFRDNPYTLDTDEYTVEKTMQSRKVALIEKSDGCIAIPGGMGTFDELTEICCMNQIDLADQPVGILNVDGYFDGLVLQLRRAVQDHFMTQEDLNRILISEDIEDLLRRMDQAGQK
ncbi:MAG: TIGR00730 family Rossman fold protein [Acidaminococcaceae bacterium]|nr:TIGR00730 family Rossman fold protein [Acidaminococcaceae bacterium]